MEHHSTSQKIHPSIFLSLLFCALYLFYLASTTEMLAIMDSIGYEQQARVIAEKGWAQHFITGPYREPLYAAFLALCMILGKWLNIPYLSIALLLQLVIFFSTLLLAASLMRRLKIHPGIISLSVLYLGLSPAFVNSTLRLLSEIVTYPLVLGFVIFLHKAWLAFKNGSGLKRNLSIACAFAFLLTMTKGILEAAFPLCFAVFLLTAFLYFRQQRHFKKSLIAFCFIFLVSYFLPIASYKLLNKHFNGYHTLTDRGGWALYGNTARRMLPLNQEKLSQAIAYGPDARWCESIWGPEECITWSYETSDALGVEKRNKLAAQGLSKKALDSALMQDSFKLIFQKPFQYALLFAVETGRMFRWETTHDAFVIYPTWLTNLFENRRFEIPLCVLSITFSMASFVFTGIYLWSHRKNIPHKESLSLLGTMFLFSSLFIFAHGFFFVLTRYIFPIVPLYIIMAAFTLQQILRKQNLPRGSG